MTYLFKIPFLLGHCLGLVLTCLISVQPTYVQAQIFYRLGSTYTLTDYRVENNEIFISFSGIKNLPLCAPLVPNDPRLTMLERIRAGNRKVEVYANPGSVCIDYVNPTPSAAERLALVEEGLKTALPQASIRLADFDKIQINELAFPDMRASMRFLYVPQNQIGIKSMVVDWRKKDPSTAIYYYVSIIHAYRNTPTSNGYEEVNQGYENFETLPYITTRINPALLASIRAAANKHAPGLLKPTGKGLTDILILEKPEVWLVKRIEHGECSEDRTILTLRINRTSHRPILPVLSENHYGGECPD